MQGGDACIDQPLALPAVGIAGAGNARRIVGFLSHQGKWLIILPPLLFLLVFFLIPFGFALSISFADTAVRVPPFTDILSRSPDWHIHLTLNLGNFKYLFTDEAYGLSYLYSLKTAFFSTMICLLPPRGSIFWSATSVWVLNGVRMRVSVRGALPKVKAGAADHAARSNQLAMQPQPGS